MARRLTGGMMRLVRDTLELLRFRLFDDWPWRGALARGDARRRELAPRLAQPPPLGSRADADAEVHVLSGEAQADMGMVSSWSLLRFLPRARLVVHSDGTLGEASQRRWSALVPGASFRSREERDAAALAALEGLPRLSAWRRVNWAAAQTIDFHALGGADAVLSLDTDVLCFREPREVLDWLRGPRRGARWNEDLVTRYSAPAHTLARLTGHAVPERLNCGFMCLPRLGRADFERLERDLAPMEAAGLDMNQRWSSQTYLALMLAHHEGSRALGRDYRVRRGATREDAVLRHYVGMPSVRFRLFTEGWPRVLT